ncbi:MAG: hypothetical protein SFU83_20140 [Meiothermus sp.]|nr:hypothetical protein [Meiothermus sp.]
MKDDELDVPSPTRQDTVYGLIKGAISTIPVAGGAVAELFQTLVTPPLERRRTRFFTELVAKLQSLEGAKHDISLESLLSTDRGMSAFLTAYSIAIKNHQTEKIRALINSVINSGTAWNVEEDLDTIFLHHIDQLTTLHLVCLLFIYGEQGMEAGFRLHDSSIVDQKQEIPSATFHSIESAFDELARSLDKALFDNSVGFDLLRKLLTDLRNMGFLFDQRTDGHTAIQKILFFRWFQNNLGRLFIEFISEKPDFETLIVNSHQYAQEVEMQATDWVKYRVVQGKQGHTDFHDLRAAELFLNSEQAATELQEVALRWKCNGCTCGHGFKSPHKATLCSTLTKEWPEIGRVDVVLSTLKQK